MEIFFKKGTTNKIKFSFKLWSAIENKFCKSIDYFTLAMIVEF